MPQSLSAIYLHAVFSTKHRTPYLLDIDTRTRMHHYIGGIVNKLGCQSLIVGGVEDHVHILFRHSRTETVAKVIGAIKSNSSAWAKTEAGLRGFEWQAGYGVFSVGMREFEVERHYIERQEEHHKKVSFQDELRNLLQEHGMEYDEKYVCD